MNDGIAKHCFDPIEACIAMAQDISQWKKSNPLTSDKGWFINEKEDAVNHVALQPIQNQYFQAFVHDHGSIYSACLQPTVCSLSIALQPMTPDCEKESERM